jgi:oligopeptide transport system substrate-binding protein
MSIEWNQEPAGGWCALGPLPRPLPEGEGIGGKRRGLGKGLCGLLVLLFVHTTYAQWNNPYSDNSPTEKVLYASFAERPKTLDPARSYSSNEYAILGQIYESPLQYHYLKRPLVLEPLTATAMPETTYYDSHGQVLPADAKPESIATTVFTLSIKPGIYYAPHPALAKDSQGEYAYHHLDSDYVNDNDIYSLNDFPLTGTRELTAEDYVNQIKRIADPKSESPIFGLMSDYILGFKEFQKKLLAQPKRIPGDLRLLTLEGAKVLDRYHYQITIHGKYPQFMYWLAMPFFSPMPWEADVFYAQPGLDDHDISLSWYPIGTGPYRLTENNPSRRMVLEKNPRFHGEVYPSEGAPGDAEKGLLAEAGKPLPFIDKVIMTLEVETIPRWNKFLQGYYDNSGISSDSFDQAIHMSNDGKAQLTPEMQTRQIRLQSIVAPSINYLGFNMLDPLVGGSSERARKLRQAISIALDYEEFIAIFLNGRGIAAQGPVPPGIFGFQEGPAGINPVVYDVVDNKPVRKKTEVAKKLLAEAGYPEGRDPKTGERLLLNYDVPTSTAPEDKARFDWMRKQFSNLGLELNIRGTQYNRFQEKMRTGDAQLFTWGWHADYPDPENFLISLYGPNGKVKFGGENATNYQNPEFDRLFMMMKNMDNSPERQQIINKMITIARQDAPWLFGFHPKDFTLSHHWVMPNKPTEIATNTLKYARIDPAERALERVRWNKPILWPLGVFVLLIFLSIIPVAVRFWRQEYRRG